MVAVKTKRKKAKLDRQSESLKGRKDYSRYDGGSNTDDEITDITSDNLYPFMKEYYQAKVKITEAAGEGIKLETISKGTGKVWLAERKKRLTASNVGSIAKRKAKTNKVKHLLYTSFNGNMAIKWGLLQEEPTKTKYYLEEKQAILSPDYNVIPCGLVVRVNNPWLGASPDGLVYDSTEDPPDDIIKLKNPYSVRDLALREANGFFLKVNSETDCLELKKSHDYFYQIQCTLYN